MRVPLRRRERCLTDGHHDGVGQQGAHDRSDINGGVSARDPGKPDRSVGARWWRSVGGRRPGQVGFGTGAVGVAPAGHDRGSQGWRLDVEGDGAAIAAAVGEVVDVVDGVVEVDELLTVPVVGVVGTGGAVTANWVPVTTVTWAPSAT